MAGSYRHVTNDDGSYRGVDLLDSMGDADEALEECVAIIQQANALLREWYAFGKHGAYCGCKLCCRTSKHLEEVGRG